MKRTKTYIINCALCCAVLLPAGCVRQAAGPDPAPAGGDVVGLDISSLKTRGNTILGPDEILSMGIFGYSTDYDVTDPADPQTRNLTTAPSLINNQKATRTSSGADPVVLSEWTYNPVAYWPLDLSVKNSFFAYSPHSSDFPEGATVSVATAPSGGYTYPRITYTLPMGNLADNESENPGTSAMVDLLYAVPVLNKNHESTGKVDDGRVIYDMKHALTWLSFMIAPVETYTAEEKAEKGTEYYKIDWLAFLSDAIPVTATLDLGSGTWNESTMTRGTRDYVFEFADSDSDGMVQIEAGTVGTVIDPSNRLMLLPFNITEEANVTIDITFWHDGMQYYYYVPFPTQRMTAGNALVYVLNISPEGITLEFLDENTIEEWDKLHDDVGGHNVGVY